MDEFDEIKKGFLDEAEQSLTDSEQCFLSIEKDQSPDVLDKLFRLAHNIKGSANAVGFLDLGAFTHNLETLLLKIKNGEVTIDSHVVDILLQCNDHLKFFVAELKVDMNAKADSTQLLSEINGIINQQPREAAPPAEAAEASSPTLSVSVSLSNDAIDDAFSPTKSEVELLQQSPDQADPFDQEQTEEAPEVHAAAEEIPVVQVIAAPKSAAPASTSEESIRVSLGRLEKLINYVGEMVILQAVLKEQTNLNGTPLIKKTVHQLGKVTKEVQDISMGLRMLPMKQTFQKMVRIVRDTSRALNKEINFETTGDDTELDKMVLEQLGDPLVHLVRNAVDHGIEPADVRIAKGKNPVGTVRLKAYHRVGQIIIEVSDDGGGLDAQKLLASAIKKGLLKPGTQMSNEDAYRIVFLPGFSTKEAVTDVSGRGVGMDVVKTNIEMLRGSIQIFTTPNQGTSFQITLPLTLAIIDAMIILQEKQRYVIPLHQVYESVDEDKMRLQTVSEAAEILLLRGENIPFYRLSKLLGKSTVAGAGAKSASVKMGSALIIRNAQNTAVAILVDAIVGQSQAVIKPLGAEVRHIKGFSGSAILGDGLPAVILDVPELVRRVQGSSSTTSTSSASATGSKTPGRLAA